MKTEIQTHGGNIRSRSIINRQGWERQFLPQIRDSERAREACVVQVAGQGGAIGGGTRATPSAPSRVGFRHQSGSSLKHAGNGSDSLECRGSGNPLVLLSAALSNGSTASLSLSLSSCFPPFSSRKLAEKERWRFFQEQLEKVWKIQDLSIVLTMTIDLINFSVEREREGGVEATKFLERRGWNYLDVRSSWIKMYRKWERNDKKWKRSRKIVTLHPSWIRGNAFQCKHWHSLFCTSNIRDQISFIRASIIRKSYLKGSVKLRVRIVGGLSIDSFLFRRKRVFLKYLIYSYNKIKFVSKRKE